MNATYLFIYAALFGGLLAASLARSRSPLAPAPLWNACWALLFLSAGVLGQAYEYDASSTALLFFLAASFNVVPLLASHDAHEYSVEKRRSLSSALDFPAWLLVMTGLVGLLGAVQLSSQLGTSLLSADSLARALEASSDNASLIYRGEVVRSSFGTMSYAVMQFGFAALGARMRIRPDRWIWLVLPLNILSAAAWTLVTTQRSYFLVSILWLVAGYVAAAVASGNEKISLKLTVSAVSAVVALTIFVVASRAVRVSGANAQLDANAWSSATLWAAGYIPTFSSWHAAGGGSEIYPFRLLAGVFSAFGLAIETGVQADGETFTYIGNGQLSNASTMMRAAVLGGGIVGAFLIVIALGAISAAIYHASRRGSPLAAGAYVGVVATILWSINAWHFTNANRVIAQVLIMGAIGASFTITQKRYADAHRQTRTSACQHR
ncbi:O-antigen polymerase [Microbacterium sp. NPDC077391]|uniref:O-antigen polymerase n=1 Tax=Microbacterium sp. NPDC077391 TaxID=3154765 RepID=UPI003428FF16